MRRPNQVQPGGPFVLLSESVLCMQSENAGRWASIFYRHEKVAFQLSGGRDSTAALYLLRDYWPRITVYHLDTGDHFPTTRKTVALIEADLEDDGFCLTRIPSSSRSLREQYGMPSDVVPVDNHSELGRMVSGSEIKIQSRYECCIRSLMMPMHQRMIDDGVTMIIRGQRDDEYVTPPFRSGESGGGFEFLYPVQDWTGDQVADFLKANNLPVADFYEFGAKHGSDCMGCTAWWDDGRAPYMRKKHPKEYAILVERVTSIRSEVMRQLSRMDDVLLGE